MKTRITKKDLEARIAKLNEQAGFGDTPLWRRVDGRNVATIGMFVHDAACGGHKVSRITNEGGAQSGVTHGYVTPRETIAQLDKLIAQGRISTLSLRGYLYQCIDLSEYDMENTLNNLIKIIDQEKQLNRLRHKNRAEQCQDWLQGLPSALNIEFANYEIMVLNERHNWGLKSVGEYWTRCGEVLANMIRGW